MVDAAVAKAESMTVPVTVVVVERIGDHLGDVADGPGARWHLGHVQRLFVIVIPAGVAADGMMVSRMAIARWLSSRCSAMGLGSGALCPPLGARLGLSKLR
jgi:hypothetical protein